MGLGRSSLERELSLYFHELDSKLLSYHLHLQRWKAYQRKNQSRYESDSKFLCYLSRDPHLHFQHWKAYQRKNQSRYELTLGNHRCWMHGSRRWVAATCWAGASQTWLTLPSSGHSTASRASIPSRKCWSRYCEHVARVCVSWGCWWGVRRAFARPHVRRRLRSPKLHKTKQY